MAGGRRGKKPGTGGKSSKRINVQQNALVKEEERELQKEEVICPICYSLILEPVTFPCHHNVCKECFEAHIEVTSIYCPVCRCRLSIWARQAVKKNAIINYKLQEKIEQQFPAQVEAQRRRLQHQGQLVPDQEIVKAEDTSPMIDPVVDDDDVLLASFLADDSPSVLDGEIVQPGEIAKDFDIIYSKHREDLEKEQIEAERATEEFIKENVTEEDIEILTQLEQDLKLAQELQRVEEEDKKQSLRSHSTSTTPNSHVNTFWQSQSQQQQQSQPLQSPRTPTSTASTKIITKTTPTFSLSSKKRRHSVGLTSSKNAKRNRSSSSSTSKTSTPPTAKGFQMKIGHFFSPSSDAKQSEVKHEIFSHGGFIHQDDAPLSELKPNFSSPPSQQHLFDDSSSDIEDFQLQRKKTTNKEKTASPAKLPTYSSTEQIHSSPEVSIKIGVRQDIFETENYDNNSQKENIPGHQPASLPVCQHPPDDEKPGPSGACRMRVFEEPNFEIVTAEFDIDFQKLLEQRLKQEEEDRKLALELQRLYNNSNEESFGGGPAVTEKNSIRSS